MKNSVRTLVLPLRIRACLLVATELKLKYTPFNVDALEEVACKAVEAERCLEWEKIGEGQ